MSAAMWARRIVDVVCGVLALGASAVQAQSDVHEFVYCDNGVRCIRAPCPSRSAKDLQTGQILRGIRLDLGGLNVADRTRSDLQDALYHGTLVLGGQKQAGPPESGGKVTDVLRIERIVRAATKAERTHCSSRR